MDLRVLHYFLTVAKEQSFTRAAAQLHITQPTLSRQLAALEGELGTVLFDRGGRSITLTDEGILLKRRALEIIDLEDKIIDEFKGSNDVVEIKEDGLTFVVEEVKDKRITRVRLHIEPPAEEEE